MALMDEITIAVLILTAVVVVSIAVSYLATGRKSDRQHVDSQRKADDYHTDSQREHAITHTDASQQHAHSQREHSDTQRKVDEAHQSITDMGGAVEGVRISIDDSAEALKYEGEKERAEGKKERAEAAKDRVETKKIREGIFRHFVQWLKTVTPKKPK
jgi:hypothetical protein